MKTRKVTVNVKVEVLSVDAVYARLVEVANLISQEQTSGNLRQDDGDETTWETEFVDVEF